MKSQRGRFALGLVVGVLIGLVMALGVALYVTKVPVPFINKVPQRTAEQDNAEAERNKNWDPNAALAGKSASAPAAPVRPVPLETAPPRIPAPAQAPGGHVPAEHSVTPPATARPALRPGSEGFDYFTQAGAYSRAEEAQSQRARLALLGLDTKITEREQAGRTIYRVRVGPFEKREAAEAVQQRLQASDIESSLVRVERQ
jgi:cell division protein FtsN